MNKIIPIFLATMTIVLFSCQSDPSSEQNSDGEAPQNNQRETEMPSDPTNLEIIDAQFDEEGRSEFTGQITGKDSRYHIVEAPEGSTIELQLKSVHPGAQISLIKPLGGKLWEETTSEPNEKLNWSGTLPTGGKFTVEVALTGRMKDQDKAAPYSLKINKPPPE